MERVVKMRSAATVMAMLALCGATVGCESSGTSGAATLATTTQPASGSVAAVPSTTDPDWLVDAGRIVVTHTRGVDQAFFEEGGVSIVVITDSAGREVAAAKAGEPRFGEPVTLLAISLPPGTYRTANYLRSCETECRLGLGPPNAGCSATFEVVQNGAVAVDYTYFAGRSPLCEIKVDEVMPE